MITAAGPFSIHGGEELLRAAAELGVHYADTSDEPLGVRFFVGVPNLVAMPLLLVVRPRAPFVASLLHS